MPERIAGTAFFPGGSGLWLPDENLELPPMPIGKVMVLGHDFHSLRAYQQSLARGVEDLQGPTWRNLLSLLKRANISPTDCFFTNAYMGLRESNSAIGQFPGSRNPAFVALCQNFLAEQICILRPRLILALGRYVPSILAPLSDDLKPWHRRKTLSELDAAQVPLIHNVRFGENQDVVATTVALTHPCLWSANVGRRRYRSESGGNAELLMLKEALELIDFHNSKLTS